MRFHFEAAGIGSVPFKDPSETCRIIFNSFTKIPFWPQLPKRSFLENMYAQFSKGLPGLVLDQAKKTMHIDTSRVAHDIEEVYGKYLDGDIEFFKIEEEYAQGLYKFIEALKFGAKGIKFVKGHITGPISYALFLTDQNRRSVIYDRDLFEVLTKVLVMKARWQIRRLKRVFPSVMIFIDEPYLVSIGSSFVNIDLASAFEKLDEVIKAIKTEGALCGIHCCGNTDWGTLLKRDIDIINFDAYNFSKEFFLYTQDVKKFIGKGGTIAWGIVPSSEAIKDSSAKVLSERLSSAMALLTAGEMKKDEVSSLVTTSCGLGTLDEGEATKAFLIVKKLSEGLNKTRTG